jgi:hypothetical protein
MSQVIKLNLRNKDVKLNSVEEDEVSKLYGDERIKQGWLSWYQAKDEYLKRKKDQTLKKWL